MVYFNLSRNKMQHLKTSEFDIIFNATILFLFFQSVKHQNTLCIRRIWKTKYQQTCVHLCPHNLTLLLVKGSLFVHCPFVCQFRRGCCQQSPLAWCKMQNTIYFYLFIYYYIIKIRNKNIYLTILNHFITIHLPRPLPNENMKAKIR